MMRYVFPAVIGAVLVPGFAPGSPQDKRVDVQEEAQAPKLSPEVEAKAKALLQKLGSPDFEERQAAAKELQDLGKPILPLLERAAEASADPELRWQARRLARKIAAGDSSEGGLERERGESPRAPRTPFDRPSRPGVAPDFFEEMQRHMQEMQRHMERAMRGVPPFPVDPPGASQSMGQSVRIEMTPDGVRVETEDAKDGKTDKKVYEARNMEELLKKYPQLEGRVSGYSSPRRPGAPFGPDLDRRWEQEIEKSMERARRAFRTFDWDLDRDGDFGWKIKVATPDGVKELKGGDAKRAKGDGEKKEESRKDAAEGGLEKVPADGPRLGVYVRPGLSEEVREYLGLPAGVGLWVEKVAEDSLAAKARLEPGDIVTRLNGNWIRDAGDVQKALRDGTDVKVEFVRKGVEKSSVVTK